MPPPITIDLIRFLACIAMVETGNNDKAMPAGRGAQSRYGITLTVWEQHGGNVHTFYTSCNNGRAERVALKHITWLDEQVPKESTLERQMRPWCLAFAWKAGLQGYLRNDNRIENNNYSVRVLNLYDDKSFKP